MATANCPSYQCSDVEAYPGADSCTTYKGGSNRIILFKCGLDVDISNGPEIETAITNGDAIDYKNVKINWDAPSIVTSPSYVGCVPDVPAAYDNSITFIDRNVTSDSVDHYNSANASTGFTFGAALIYECSADRWSYIVAPITLQGGRAFPDQDNDLQRFEHQLIYRSQNASPRILATAPVFS